MPIKSYLAHAQEGQLESLVSALNQWPECEVIPSTNKAVAVLVTDTPSEEEDALIIEKIQQLDCLKMLSMVSGFQTEDQV